jgi:hypothetical protein
MGNLRVTEIADFSAGMDTVQAPHLIAQNEARTIINVDLNRSSLLSVPNLDYLHNLEHDHFVEFQGEAYTYDGFRSVAFMDNNLYWSNGVTTGKVLRDGRELALGIAVPSAPPTIQIGAGVGPHLGDFKYCYTFYSSDTGVESAPSPLTLYLTANKEVIEVSNFEPFPTDTDGNPVADKYRIYRIGGYLARFTMVAEVDTDATFVDTLDDASIDGRLLSTLRTEPPMAGLNDFTELNGRLFASAGAYLYFSALGNPDYWYSSNFYIMPDDITGLAKSPAGLLVFGHTFTYLLYGTGVENFRLRQISDSIGCVARETINYIRGNAIWLSDVGICIADGFGVENVTINKIRDLKSLNPTSSAVVNDVYYLSFLPSLVPSDELFPSDTLLPSSPQGVSDIQEGMIAIDFKRGKGGSFTLFDYPSISSIGVLRGELNVVTKVIGDTFLDCNAPLACDAFLECSNNSLNLFGRRRLQGLKRVTYISPKFIDGSYSTLKEYDKVRINYNGLFKVQVVFSDGTVPVEETIVSTDDYLNLVDADLEFGDSLAIIGIPNSKNKSYSISFRITGYGEIKSIQYSWTPREIV